MSAEVLREAASLTEDAAVVSAVAQRIEEHAAHHRSSNSPYGHVCPSDCIARSVLLKVDGILAARARPASVDAETLTEAERTFIGSSALLTALYETVLAHPHMFEPDGPDGPYVWCVDGWRSDDHGGPGGAATAWAVHLSNALHAEAVKALQPLVERKGALPASVDAETLAEEAFWREQESGTTQRDRGGYYHRGFIGGYVAALASGVTLAADREPDGLRAQVEAEERERIAQAVKALPTTRTQAWLKGWDSVSLADVLALLAHPATDQEEADRG